jgi:hypothetical protein
MVWVGDSFVRGFTLKYPEIIPKTPLIPSMDPIQRRTPPPKRQTEDTFLSGIQSVFRIMYVSHGIKVQVTHDPAVHIQVMYFRRSCQ